MRTVRNTAISLGVTPMPETDTKPAVNEDLSNWGEWAAKVQKMVPALLWSLDLRRAEHEGRVESKREDLLEFLRARFGTVSPELEQRIANTSDLPTLTRWIRAAATVSRPEDLPL